jgi:hypothetical protein
MPAKLEESYMKIAIFCSILTERLQKNCYLGSIDSGSNPGSPTKLPYFQFISG